MAIDISIVIPVYNEQDKIISAVEEFFGHFKKDKRVRQSELILCENGSNDNTLSLATSLQQKYPQLKVIHIPQKAIGAALRKGIKKAKYPYIYLTGIDNPFGFADFDAFLDKIDHFDIVFASKNHPLSSYQAPFIRIMASRIISFFIRILFSIRLTDTQSNFLARKKSLFSILPHCKSDGPFFQTQIGIYATCKGFKIGEIPISYISQKSRRHFRLRDGLTLLFELLKERLATIGRP
ncbi:glycosyltransferase [Candidatus Gottesmanbacteria bacterium]|nr:glycosyltransferase [Candidatus Gottesmanbacteria bacterium]